MSATRVTQQVNAPPERVYRALLDRDAVATWMVPEGMRSEVHTFEAREGGAFRISLTYDAPTGTGKTTAQTDTYHGRFVKLVPNELVAETVEFETPDPAMQGEMTITIRLEEHDGGTVITAVHDGLPPGLSPADNELGWRSSLGKLAALVTKTDVEPGHERGPMPTSMNGKICYLELPAADVARSADFYARAFGWQIRTRGDGCTAFDDTTGQVSGAWVQGRQPAAEPGLLFYVMVDDVAATLERVVALGGTVAQAIGMDAPEVTARFRDPGGNVVGLYQEPRGS